MPGLAWSTPSAVEYVNVGLSHHWERILHFGCILLFVIALHMPDLWTIFVKFSIGYFLAFIIV